MRECCFALIEWYRRAWGGDTEGAALFCRVCGARVVHHKGTWGVSE